MKPETKEKKHLIKEFDRYGYKLIFWQSKALGEMWMVEEYGRPRIAVSGKGNDKLGELLLQVSQGEGLI